MATIWSILDGGPGKIKRLIIMQITKEAIITILKDMGYEAEARDVIKNGVVLTGIIIKGASNISPCIYIEELVANYNSIYEIATKIIDIYEANKAFSIDVNVLTNSDWILSHVYWGLQRESKEDIIKTLSCYANIEQYLYVREKDYSIKLTPAYVNTSGLTIQQLFDAANRNTFSKGETTITNMASVLGEMIDDFAQEDSKLPFYVITNRSRVKGSSQILDKDAIRVWASTQNPVPSKIICIPSSIHECLLLLPQNGIADDIYQLDFLNQAIVSINNEVVDKTEQLGDNAFYICLD